MSIASAWKIKRSTTLTHVGILALLGMQLFPVYMMLQISTKDNRSFLSHPWWPSWPTDWNAENWSFAVGLITPYLLNSFFVAILATVGGLGIAILAAYFFARYRMPFSRMFWSAFVVLMLMPTVANLVPLFSLLKSLHLLNSLWALVLVGMAGSQVFNIYVLRNFIEEIPHELFEAAEVDGATHFRQILSVVIPMSLPIIGTLSIISFVERWNEFLFPLIILRDKDLFTVGVGLVYLDGEYVKQWGRIMAAFCVSSVPLVVLFMFAMRWFVRGLASGAVKG